MTDRTEMRRLLDDATPGPWHAWNRGIGFEVHTEAEHNPIRCDPLNSGFRETFRGPDAQLIAAAVNALPSLLDQLDAAEAALARVRELHERWPIHGDGDHPEDCDCGDPWVTVCRLCCTDGKDQHEHCAVYHDHGPDKPICPTITAIGGEQSC